MLRVRELIKDRGPVSGRDESVRDMRRVVGVLAVLAWSAATANGAEVLAYAAGDVAQCGEAPAQKSVAARTAKMIPDNAVVFVIGDTAYPHATHATLESCYAPTWGRFLSRTYAVPGNHDYVHGSAADFLDYFGARTPHETWFRVQVDDWWVIGLDSNLSPEKLAQQGRSGCKASCIRSRATAAVCWQCGTTRCFPLDSTTATAIVCGRSGRTSIARARTWC